MQPNSDRGEVTLQLGEDCAFILRPTMQALKEIEAECGAGIIAVAMRFASQQFGTTEICAVIRAGIRGAGEQPPKDLEERIVQHGIANLSGVLAQFIESALYGGGIKKKP